MSLELQGYATDVWLAAVRAPGCIMAHITTWQLPLCWEHMQETGKSHSKT